MSVEGSNQQNDSRLNNFVTQIIDQDIAEGKLKNGEVVTRFPPEPNGWLHLGHAKSICLNFGIAKQYGGRCHLRFDDTNPAVEEDEYINGIQKDVKWLGFDWGEHLYYASDYFDQLYDYAIVLIKKGLAYVDEQSEEDVRTNRGSLTKPGVDSPYRNRPIEENLDLFERMKKGDFPDGHCILRAKINMAHGNMNMRDPPIYRIKHTPHPRTGDKWCIYPIYDFAHGQSDSIEKITHSVCTLEFFDHRLLYDWFQEHLDIHRSQQIEFARLNLTHTLMSKRRLLKLVKENIVNGWDDPRMPTLAGCRRRGYDSASIRDFAVDVGVAKRDIVIPYERLEFHVREKLKDVPRRIAVLKPLKVTITNWPEDAEPEIVTAQNHPEIPALGTRDLIFDKEIYIDIEDFNENPPADFHRLTVNGEVRLRYSYWIKCTEVVKNEAGEPIELKCTYDPSTKGGKPPADKRKVKGVIHWLSSRSSVRAEIRRYGYLFAKPDPDDVPEGGSWVDNLNPKSLVIENKALIETSIAQGEVGERFQFERVGYFARDPDSTSDKAVFNLIVDLIDTFAAKADQSSKEAKSKESDRLAREQAAEERRLKKEAKAKRLAEKAAAAAAGGEEK